MARVCLLHSSNSPERTFSHLACFGKGNFFIDLCLTFGLSSACKIFQRVCGYSAVDSPELGTNRISLPLP